MGYERFDMDIWGPEYLKCEMDIQGPKYPKCEMDVWVFGVLTPEMSLGPPFGVTLVRIFLSFYLKPVENIRIINSQNVNHLIRIKVRYKLNNKKLDRK